MFKGPNDGRRVRGQQTTTTAAANEKKVIKRDIFSNADGDEPSFAQPKELGQPEAPSKRAPVAAAKKSLLDDEDDDDAGLDFLKKDKKKVNYDDDDIFTAKKPTPAAFIQTKDAAHKQ